MRTSSYHRPLSLEEAWRLRRADDGARYLAGGTDVLLGGDGPPASLVSLRRIPGLAGIEGGRIGALTRIADVAADPGLAASRSVLVQAARRIGSAQIRSVATVGGNLCRAAPCADLAPPLLVLDATAVIRGAEGEREVALEAFFRGPGVTCLEADEILVAVDLPPSRPGAQGVFLKKGRVRMDLSIASVAVQLEAEGSRCLRLRAAAGSVAPVPMRLKEVEALLEGRDLDDEPLLREAEALASASVMPITDIRSTEAYRRRITGVYLRRAVVAALAAGAAAERGHA